MQDVFWASKQYALIIIFQALDAAGKDSTIKHVMSGVNPQGVNVHSFKAPTEEERLHHFLWRPMRVLPPAGTIAIFNRSYYEEVLVVRVHPEFLEGQRFAASARKKGLDHVWQSRYEDINAFEKTLGKGKHARPEVLSERFARGATKAILGAAGRPGEELEVLGRRPERAGALGRVSAGVRRHAECDQHRSGAVVRHSGRQEVVRAGLRGRHHHGTARELDLKYPTVPESGSSGAGRSEAAA